MIMDLKLARNLNEAPKLLQILRSGPYYAQSHDSCATVVRV